MNVRIALVTENTPAFLNQVKLCLFSVRKNGGMLRNTPVTVVSVAEELPERERVFLKEQFGPIEFVVMPRLGAIPHTSKLNALYGIDPAGYDVLIYLDCDTVVLGALDAMLDPIKNGADFVCRRGGQTDRDRFVDFDGLVRQYCGDARDRTVVYNGANEWPMFNTGVFVTTSEAVQKIRRNAVAYTYAIYNEWLVRHHAENLPILKHLFRWNMLRSKKPVRESWPIEQGGLALASIKAGVQVQYLDEIYNSWGNLEDLRILHCFKSTYQFDRENMFTEKAGAWIDEYKNSDIPGKVSFAHLVEEYKDFLNK